MTTNVKQEDGIVKATYDSSNIVSSTYDTTNNTLYVTFVKGNMTYQYDNVKPEDYFKLQDSDSTGKAFIEFIKNRYLGVKLEVDGLP
jgi:hypothetical protein